MTYSVYMEAVRDLTVVTPRITRETTQHFPECLQHTEYRTPIPEHLFREYTVFLSEIRTCPSDLILLRNFEPFSVTPKVSLESTVVDGPLNVRSETLQFCVWHPGLHRQDDCLDSPSDTFNDFWWHWFLYIPL
ncbi:hypothetical protein M758_4G005800 [Ceratodon purpureus]|nr:hypothetical protein M758_4G005800 [Ceratodon purpureus]